MSYNELTKEFKKKYGRKYFKLCRKYKINPDIGNGVLILVKSANNKYVWTFNPYYEWL